MTAASGRADLIRTFPPDAVPAQYLRHRLDRWADAQLVDAVTRIVATPKVAPADSFVLHAPLELLARVRLLGHLSARDREPARQRIAGLAAAYAAAGAEIDPPPLRPDLTPEHAAVDLVAAIAAGDLDAVDPLAATLGAITTPVDLGPRLGPALIASLAAAGHASILLYLWPRTPGLGASAGDLLRGPARELARNPGWSLRWIDVQPPAGRRPETPAAPPATALIDALAALPALGVPGNTFIYPLMHQVDECEAAVELLRAGIERSPDTGSAARQLSRVAAWSMLGEPDEHAPYGWTHCLTIPQAVMGLAAHGVEPRRAVAVAATHVAGFRGALAQRPLDRAPMAQSATARGTLDDALAAGPAAAAAHAWHATEAERGGLRAALAASASRHHDAHLVKYTLACFDSAAADPTETRLYLAAAASLAAYWAGQPGDGFFD